MGANRAAFRLYYSGEQKGFQYFPLADTNYLECMNLLDYMEPNLTTCKQLSRANVIVEFIGIKRGGHTVIQEPAPTSNRVDITRGLGVYQRFVCRRRRRRRSRKEKKRSRKCVVFPITSSTLAAGVAVRRNTSAMFGYTDNDNTNINEEAESAMDFAEQMHASFVEEALDSGHSVLRAGDFAYRNYGAVQLAREVPPGGNHS